MANELRLRAGAIGGQVEDNPLTNSATTLTSAGLAAMPAVGSTQHMAVVLDPDGIFGAPEVAWVTAHTAGATTATIARGKESTTARQHDRDVFWIHGPTLADFLTVRSAEGTDGATRTSTTLGAWSTPWTLTIPVIEGQAVELDLMMAITTGVDDTIYAAIRRTSGTPATIYEQTHYTGSSAVQTQVQHHYWRDTTPGTGDVTYEVYVATNAQTATLRNGATLDTTKEATQGKSIFVAKAMVM